MAAEANDARERAHSTDTDIGRDRVGAEALQAIRAVGDHLVLVTVTKVDVSLEDTPVASFRISGHEAATMMKGLISQPSMTGERKPSAKLAAAMEQARTVKPRFKTKEALFDALEAADQDQR